MVESIQIKKSYGIKLLIALNQFPSAVCRNLFHKGRDIWKIAYRTEINWF